MYFNLEATKKYYEVEGISEDYFRLPLNFCVPKIQRGFQKILFNKLQTNILYKKKLRRVLKSGEVSYLIRVDDFPRWDIPNAEFLEFDKIFREKHIPYIIGVTPFLDFKGGNYNPINNDTIQIIKDLDLCMAIHGFNHFNFNIGDWKNTTEITYYSKERLKELILKTNEFFIINSLKIPQVFIAPFNAIDEDSYDILSQHYKIITGGPLTLSTMSNSKYIMGVFLNRSMYLPSYYPFYGWGNDICNGIDEYNSIKQKLVIPITLHWSWERKDNYENLKRMLDKIQGKVISWKYYLNKIEENT